jgi:hypothetical protein
MKKKFFLGLSLIAVASLWTGCSNDDVVNPAGSKQPISFHLQGGTPDLKATGTSALHVDAFVVYGTDDSKDFGQANEFLFDGVTVARQKDGLFDYSPKRFYGEGAVNSVFYAYSPVNATSNGLAVATPVPEVVSSAINAKYTYTLPKPNSTGLTTQQDLLFAGTIPAQIQNGSNMVALTFKHVLSRIFVTATNSTLKDGDVIVTKLGLLNLKTIADIKFQSSNATWGWENFSKNDTLYYVLADKGVLVPSSTLSSVKLTSMEQGMMIIPQKAINTGDLAKYDTGDFALKVEYDLGNLKNQVKYIVLKKDYEFQPGYQYNINIDFKGNTIEFEMSVEPWVDGTVVYP